MSGLIEEAHYNKVFLDWKFLLNGDFTGRYQFEFVNSGYTELSTLPPFDIVLWAVPNIQSVEHRVVNGDRNIHRFERGGHKIVNSIVRLFDHATTFVEFRYTVYPSLKPGEKIAYEILLESKETEPSASGERGSILGISAPIPIRSARLHCTSPPKFKLVLLSGPIVLDSDGNEQVAEEIDIPAPAVGELGTSLQWNLDHLASKRGYWLKYKFVKETYDA
jgi:hypothetical protein